MLNLERRPVSRLPFFRKLTNVSLVLPGLRENTLLRLKNILNPVFTGFPLDNFLNFCWFSPLHRKNPMPGIGYLHAIFVFKII